jgi:hypothetical protein
MFQEYKVAGIQMWRHDHTQPQNAMGRKGMVRHYVVVVVVAFAVKDHNLLGICTHNRERERFKR